MAMRGPNLGAALAALLAAGTLPAMAQSIAEPAASSDIVVTGSHLQGSSVATPTLVTVLPVDTLLDTTPTGLPDALNKLPQFELSSSPSRSTHNFMDSGSNGNILNLRGVGGIRTLVLLDGLRVAPTTYQGEVDVDVLPGLLIQRVEIAASGASAAYGSDAVSGAVNFVLDTQFTGVNAIAQSGISGHGADANWRIGAAIGSAILGKRGHLILSGEATLSDGMRRSDRPDGTRALVFAGATGIGAPGSATNPLVIRDDARLTTASQYGLIAGPAGNPFVNYRFAADGSLVPFNPGMATGTPGFAIGGDGFAIPANSTAVAATETKKAFGRLTYALTPDVEVFAQAGLGQNDETYVSLANSFLDPTPAQLFSGNPYLPSAIQNSLSGPDDAITLERYGGTEPQPATHERTRFVVATLGAKNDQHAAIRWKFAYTISRSAHDAAQAGVWDWQHTYAALDAVRDASGAIVCRATLDPDPAIRARFAGCQPLIILISGAAFTSQPGYAYAVGTSRYRAATGQDDAVLQVNASPLHIRGRPINIALGGEYRRQTLDLTSNADPAQLQSANDRSAYFAGLRGVSPSALAYWLTDVGTAKGAVGVGETFVEAGLPLSSALGVNAAARLTHYSTSGTELTWKAGTQWQAVPALRLMASVSRDSRAPSLFELYGGQQSGIGLLIDPRSGLTGNVASISGGNPTLRPERSTTLNLGVVATPRSVAGLTVSITYYRLKISGQINSLTISQIAQNCFSAGPGAPECALVDQPDPTRLPTTIRTIPINTAFLDAAGIDIDAAWHRRLGSGNLGVKILGSYMDRYLTQQYAGAPVLDYAGYGETANQPIGRPRLRGTANIEYGRGGFGLSVSEQYIGGLKIGSQEPDQNYNGMAVGPVFYSDLSLRQQLHGCGCNAEMFFTVNNAFDRSPPLVPGTTPALNYPTIISLYDVVGREFTVGVKVKI